MNQSDNNSFLTRRVAKVLPTPEGLQKLAEKRPVKVYVGIDPTGSRLHIGHTIGLRLLMDFAKAGHEATLLFGTGTVLVGDPSLRDSARTTIAEEEIRSNIKTWKEQASKVIDFDKVKIVENGDWLTKMTLKDLVHVASQISATQLFKRESFTRRIAKGDTVWYHETMYPLLQGYDSVELDTDVEIGGTDQEFNMLMGRELLKKMKSKEKYVVENHMILGTDGKQMSKSSGNCVWLDDTPSDMYGKLMSVPDEQIVSYATMCSEMPMDEVAALEADLKAGKNPRDLKAQMAFEITRLYHSDEEARVAAEGFDSQFQKSEVPEDIPEVSLASSSNNLADLLVEAKLVDSKSEARRMIEQGAVKYNQESVREDKSIQSKTGDVLQVGKRRFARLNV